MNGHLKTEALSEEDAAASLILSSEGAESAACDDIAPGGDGPTNQEQGNSQPNTTARILLYPVSASSRFFSSTDADGKSMLKIAPGQDMKSTPCTPERTSNSEFSYQTIVYLIQAVGRSWSLYGTRERSQLFQSVQRELEAQGHPFPVERIRRKWNNLIVTYKRVKDRGRETGQAKTSWEYFEMMDAMLGDTIGAQMNNTSVSVTTLPMTTIATEPEVTESKPLLLPNGDIITTCTQIPNLDPSFLASPHHMETNSPWTTHNIDLLQPHLSPAPVAPPLASRRTPSNVNRWRLRKQKHRSFSSFPSSSTPSFSSSSSSVAASLLEQQQTLMEEHTAQLQEFLRKQEEQAGPEQGGTGGAQARERRRERREARMAQSLGRMATALELLSSKQDTVIALLQRLADRK